MITVNDKYKELYTTSKPIILVTGGRGSAKSFNTSLFLKRLSYEKGHKILFTRYTLTSANVSIIPEFTEKISVEGDSNYFDITKAEINNNFSDSQILFRGIKTSSGNQSANLKSIQGLTTFVVDEAEEWESEDDYDKVRLSIRTKGVKNRVIIVMNPTDSTHFVYQKYIKDSHKIINIDGVDVQISTHPDVCHIHTTYLDNTEHLDEDFLKLVSGIKEKSPKDKNGNPIASSKYATKIVGRWSDKAEGAIFEYTIGEFDESLPYAYGQDYGFSVDPTTLIRVAIDERRKKLYAHEEFFDKEKLGTKSLSEKTKAHLCKLNDLVVGDSSEPRLIGDMRKEGINIKPSVKGAGSVTAGITRMQEYEIIVTPTSHNLKQEFNNYIWNDKKAGIPIDNWNHGIDAIRYAVQQLKGGGKIHGFA